MDKDLRKKIKGELYKRDPSLASHLQVQENGDHLEELKHKVDEHGKNIIDSVNNLIPSIKKDASAREFIDNLIVSIKGDKGDDGKQGERGEKGEQGLDGQRGLSGIKGKDGIDGKDGVMGERGADGNDGKDGSPDTPEQISSKLNTLKEVLDYKILKNIPVQSVKEIVQAMKKLPVTDRLEVQDIRNWNQPAKGKLDQRWHGGGVGFGTASMTQYAVVIGGTANALAQVSGLGTAGQILTSNGPGLAPTWQSDTGPVSSVSNSDGTLTISPNTGAVVASLNLAHANTWTGQQTFNTSTAIFGLPPTFGSMTAGSVLFLGTGGLVTEDNTNFFWNDTIHRLTLGDIGGSGAGPILHAKNQTASNTTGQPFTFTGSDGNGTGDGGYFLIQAGFSSIYFGASLLLSGAAHSGKPNDVQIIGASSVSGNGGDIALIPQLPNGAGTLSGNVKIEYQPTGKYAIFDASLLATTDKTFTFPNASGTFALQSSSPFTQGSVIFAGASGIYAQDNANFFWDDTNFNLGIGTNAPVTNLHVYSATPTLRFEGSAYTGNTYTGVGFSPAITSHTLYMGNRFSVGGFTFSGFSGGTTEPGLTFVGYQVASSTAPAVVFSGFKPSGTNRTAITGTTPAFMFQAGLDTSWATSIMTMLGNGRVGIGTVAPAFPLDVNGNTNIGGLLTIVSGASGGTPSVTATNTGGSNYWKLVGDNNAGYDIANWYTDGTNSVFSGMMRGSTGITGGYTIWTGGVARLNVLSTGFVGIGTTTPGYALEIDASANTTMLLNGTSFGGFIVVTKGATNIGGFGSTGAWLGDSSTDYMMGSYTGKKIKFMTNSSSTPTMTLDTSFNVGIGTTTPTAILHILRNDGTGGDDLIPQIKLQNTNTTVSSYAIMRVLVGTGYADGYPEIWLQATGDTGGYTKLRVVSNHPLYITTNDTIRATILSTGEVGIGTLTPVAKLQVISTTNTAGMFEGQTSSTSLGTGSFISIANSNATTNNRAAFYFIDTTGNSNASAGIETKFVDRTNHYGDLYLTTRAADGYNPRIYITSAGLVGIGTNVTPTAILHAKNTTSASVGVLEATANTGDATWGFGMLHLKNTSGQGPFIDYWTSSNVRWAFGISSTGNFNIRTVSDASDPVAGPTLYAYNSAGLFTIGKTGTTGGSLAFGGSSSGLVTMNVAAAAGTWALTLPTTAGSANQFLQTDGSGVTKWAAASKVVASTFEKSETGTDANILTYTTGGTDEFLVVQVATDVSAITGTSIVVTITWKDSNNATATSVLTLTAVGDGTINVPINAFTATNVVVSSVFVGVSTAYKISAFITKLN